MGTYELAELRLLDRLGVFGERRQDLRMARMTMHIVAALRSSKSGLVHLEEFLLPTLGDPEPPAEDPADEAARFDRAAALRRG